MSYYSSFKLGTLPIDRNKNCFAVMISTEAKCSIIIEQEKLNIKPEIQEEDLTIFVDDIKSWGVDITLTKEDSDYYISFASNVTKTTKRFVGTVIRTLYEGIRPSSTSDAFYNIYIHYKNLKLFLPKENTLTLFLIANNIATVNKTSFVWNTNHTLGYSHCLIKTKQQLHNFLSKENDCLYLFFGLEFDIFEKNLYILVNKAEQKYKDLYNRVIENEKKKNSVINGETEKIKQED